MVADREIIATYQGGQFVKNNVQAAPFDDEQLEIIKSQIAKNCTNEELKLFAQVCKKTGLDPFSKQIYAIKRRAKNTDGTWGETMTIQTGIDGLRVLAQRGGKYRSQTLPLFCGADGVWTELWLASTPPLAAKVGIYTTDFPEPLYAIALYKTYAQMYDGKPSGLWAKMPEVLLAKCAEALALRKACPNDTNQLYVAEEMQQADTEESPWNGTEGRATSPALEALPPAREVGIYTETPAQKRQLQKLCVDFGLVEREMMVNLSKLLVGTEMTVFADTVNNFLDGYQKGKKTMQEIEALQAGRAPTTQEIHEEFNGGA